MGSLSHCLNIDQPESELEWVHFSGYYDYLKSNDFTKHCITPLASSLWNVFGRGHFFLDVGCGGSGPRIPIESGEYLGVDGSKRLVKELNDNAQGFKNRHSLPIAIYGRIESPEEWEAEYLRKREACKGYEKLVIIMGGLLSVLIRPEHRGEFVKAYLDRFKPDGLVIYDLATLPEEWLDALPLDMTCRYEVRIPPTNFADIPPVKLARKFLIYQTRKED